MSKALFYFVLVFTCLSTLGQTPNADEQIDNLSQKVDSLEHELSYMKLSYELYTLNTDITMFANEVETKAIAIQLDIYNRKFDRRLGEVYQSYFNTCLNKKQSFSELIEAKKTFFAVKVFKYPYSEQELNTLLASYNVINYAYDTLGNSMDLLKITIDAYTKLM